MGSESCMAGMCSCAYKSVRRRACMSRCGMCRECTHRFVCVCVCVCVCVSVPVPVSVCPFSCVRFCVSVSVFVVVAILDLHKRYQRRHAGRAQVDLRDHHTYATNRREQQTHQVVNMHTDAYMLHSHVDSCMQPCKTRQVIVSAIFRVGPPQVEIGTSCPHLYSIFSSFSVQFCFLTSFSVFARSLLP